jgi:hypothetical protein
MSRGLITQFTHHYPETLGFSVLMNIPWWMRCVINLAMPFFDTYTRSKFRTHDGAEAIAQGDLLASDLLDECGGELEVSLVVCLKSRRRKLGAKVGRSLSTQRHTKTQSSRFASSAAIRISRTGLLLASPRSAGRSASGRWHQLATPYSLTSPPLVMHLHIFSQTNKHNRGYSWP